MKDIQLRAELLEYTRITIDNCHYYLSPNISLEKITESNTKEAASNLADVVYDYRLEKVVKCRWK